MYLKQMYLKRSRRRTRQRTKWCCIYSWITDGKVMWWMLLGEKSRARFGNGD